MKIAIEKMLAQLLFWIYDFIDTIGEIFNVLTGVQPASGKKSLLEVFVESAISTKVLLGLVGVSIIITAACMCVKIIKNIVKIKADGEPVSHAVTIKQGGIAVLSSVACIFFVIVFISFSTMLLNMVNEVIAPEENLTLSQNLFNLSVEQSYVLDDTHWEEREVDFFYDESGNRVQEKDPMSDDGLAWETDSEGNYKLDGNGNRIPIYVMKIERYYPYKKNPDGSLVVESGWCDSYTAEDIKWSMSPDEVFGKYEKDFLGIFEQEDKGYSRSPMVRLNSFNLFTAYLVAVIMLISMFMLSIGLVKRIYDIIVLIVCSPLVCGTIPIDDGARFRAWGDTIISKVFVAFGAVIALNVFYMISRFITGPGFDAMLLESTGLSSVAYIIFKMVLLLGGAMCINGSQVLIARIFGTSADEGREAMQSLAMITSGIRLGAVGLAGVGRVAMGTSRLVVGGTNRYGRERTGVLNYAARGVNAMGNRVGGERYEKSRGARFVRFLGRMGGRNLNQARQPANNNSARNMIQPGSIKPVGSAHKSSSAFKSDSTKR